MPTYITLIRWTQQGVEKVKESPARLAATNSRNLLNLWAEK